METTTRYSIKREDGPVWTVLTPSGEVIAVFNRKRDAAASAALHNGETDHG